MFKFKNTAARLIEIQNENEALKFNQQNQQSDLDYIAMMLDVDLGEDDNDE